MPNPYDKYSQAGSLSDLDALFGPSQPTTPRRSYKTPPMHVRKPKPVEPTPTPAEEPGWFQKYGPMVARGVGGLAGVTPWTGAIGGGVGEAVAEGIEQQDWTPELDPKRIAAETAIGAAGGGFAKLLGAGLTSIPRAIAAGAALGGASPVIRHGLEQNDWDPRNYGKELAVGAGLGGATAGGLTALFNKLHPTAPAGPGSRYEVESTAIPGGHVLGSGKQHTQYVNPIRPIVGKGDLPNVAPVASHVTEPLVPRSAEEVSTDLANFDPNAAVDTPYLAGPEPMSTTAARAADKEARDAPKQALEKTKLEELRKLFANEEGDRVPITSESVSTVDPQTGHRLGARWVPPPDEGADAGGGLGQLIAGQEPPSGDIAAEIARIKAELAQTPVEPPVSAPEAPTPAPSPLEQVLGAKTPGKARVPKPRIGKTERFNERANAIADQAGLEPPPGPDILGPEPPTAGVPVPSAPRPQGPMPPAGAEAPVPQSLAELISQVNPNRPQTKIYTPEGSVSAAPGADPAEALAALQGEAPVATPELPAAGEPATLFKGSRTDVSGEHYRNLQDLFKKGEVPKDAARLAGAGLRGEAKAAGLPTGKAAQAPPVAEAIPQAPVEAPPPTDWVNDENAIIDRLMQLPKEQRLEAFKNGATASAPIEPPSGIPAPQAPAAAPPTAEQVSELQKLLMASGAIKDPNDIPAWVKSQIAQAPEAPPLATTALKGKEDVGAPRLNKGEGYAPQDYRPPYTGPKDPQRGASTTAFATRMGLGLGGAAIGGVTDPLDDPILSAMAGGAIGLSIPTMASGLMKLGANPNVVKDAMGDLNLPDGAKRAAAKIGRVLPQWQRANYLADVFGLAANAWAGPYGSGVFGALEKGLAGDPRGWAVLNELKNPWNFFKEYSSGLDEARSLVGRAEGISEAEAPTQFEKALTAPGTILTAGDVAVRRILERHGFTPDEARVMTMTAEPFTKSGESFAHLRGFIPDITFPFKRTPINIAEQGALRTPGLGFLMQGIGAARGTRQADSLGLQLAQQGIGAGIGLGSEQLGENMAPEDAKIARRFITNAAGPYSLLAGMGLAAGQARRAGQPVGETTLKRTAQNLPFPSIEPVTGLIDFLSGKGDVPRGLYPAGLKANYDVVKDFFDKPQQFPRRKK